MILVAALLAVFLLAALVFKRIEVVSDHLSLDAYRGSARIRLEAQMQLVCRRSIKNACDYIVDVLDLPSDQCHPDSYERGRANSRVQWISRVRARRRRTLSWNGFQKHLPNLENGSTVYLPSPILNAVFDELCKRLRTEVTLVTNEGDEPVHEHTIARLESCPFIRRVYSCNWPLNTELPANFHSIPLGYQCNDAIGFKNGVALELRNNMLTRLLLPQANASQVPRLKLSGQTIDNFRGTWIPVKDRPTRVLCAMRGSGGRWTIPSIREQCRNHFRTNPDLGYVAENSLSVENYFSLHRSFAFEISPFGLGIDCYRTWEALLLGTIPIVFDAPNRDVFRRLPVVIVKDIREVTRDLLLEKHMELAPWWDRNPNWRENLTVANFLCDPCARTSRAHALSRPRAANLQGYKNPWTSISDHI